jgi:F-type H+-transporting ATPase subunit epsilon
MATMQLEIITAERIVYSDEVDVVVAPGVEGELGILPHHASLMTMLQPGELIIRKGGQENYLAVTGGFLEVMNNKVTVLADAAERSEEINEERAQAAMKAAQERLAQRGADVDLEQGMAAVRRAQVRLNVARRRTRGGQAGPGERRT